MKWKALFLGIPESSTLGQQMRASACGKGNGRTWPTSSPSFQALGDTIKVPLFNLPCNCRWHSLHPPCPLSPYPMPRFHFCKLINLTDTQMDNFLEKLASEPQQLIYNRVCWNVGGHFPPCDDPSGRKHAPLPSLSPRTSNANSFNHAMCHAACYMFKVVRKIKKYGGKFRVFSLISRNRWEAASLPLLPMNAPADARDPCISTRQCVRGHARTKHTWDRSKSSELKR